MIKSESEMLTEGLIGTFYDIDSRISKLHTHSSEVFLHLNSYLKEYHKKSKIISENASGIFEAIAGDKESNLVTELDVLLGELDSYQNKTEKDNSKDAELLKSLLGKLDYTIVIVRNFKQDLLTLQYLITNYKLAYKFQNTNKELDTTIKEWEILIYEIIFWMSKKEIEIASLRKKIIEVKKITETGKEQSSINIDNLARSLKSTNSIVFKKNKESKHNFAILKEKIKSFSESIGNIITHLQYHDIIRQKIEHVQESHLNIIESLGTETESEKTSDNKKNTDLNYQIADIVGLQAAQLILVSKEYQNAIEVITSNFQKIASDINDISLISTNFLFEEQNSDVTLLKRIKDNLDEGILLLDNNVSGIISAELKNINKTIDTISTQMQEKSIKQFKEIGEKDISKYVPDNQKNNIITQIGTMISDILEKNIVIETRLDEILEISKFIPKSVGDDGLGSQLEQEQIRLMVKISRILGNLDIDNNMLDSVLKQNATLNEEIIGKIEATINKEEYYKLFEDVLKEVIEKLNTINLTFKPEAPLSDDMKDSGEMEKIEKLYTVKTERMVYDNIKEGDPDKDITEIQEEIDGDLELF
ncbi:MAG: hypothetical protein KAS71_06430 [Bacteroidales bacterium]|nr:hypothetical protein [Bacteroidales bacterium]